MLSAAASLTRYFFASSFTACADPVCCAKAPSPRELSSECETEGVSTVSPAFSTRCAVAVRFSARRSAVLPASCIICAPLFSSVPVPRGSLSSCAVCSAIFSLASGAAVCGCRVVSPACCTACLSAIPCSACRISSLFCGSRIPYACSTSARAFALSTPLAKNLAVSSCTIPAARSCANCRTNTSSLCASCRTTGSSLCMACAAVCSAKASPSETDFPRSGEDAASMAERGSAVGAAD